MVYLHLIKESFLFRNKGDFMSNIKDLTWESHKKAEAHPLNQDLINGTINDTEYELYLIQRYLITNYLDNYLSFQYHRAEKFLEDITKEFSEDDIMPMAREYLEYLDELEERYMIAHIYVNYLGDAFGGQIIKKNNSHRQCSHLTFSGPEEIREMAKHIRLRIDDRAEELEYPANQAFQFLHGIFTDIRKLGLNDA